MRHKPLRGVVLEGNSYDVLLPYYWPMIIIALVTLCFAGCLDTESTNQVVSTSLAAVLRVQATKR
jgi:hypothetical protein